MSSSAPTYTKYRLKQMWDAGTPSPVGVSAIVNELTVWLQYNWPLPFASKPEEGADTATTKSHWCDISQKTVDAMTRFHDFFNQPTVFTLFYQAHVSARDYKEIITSLRAGINTFQMLSNSGVTGAKAFLAKFPAPFVYVMEGVIQIHKVAQEMGVPALVALPPGCSFPMSSVSPPHGVVGPRISVMPKQSRKSIFNSCSTPEAGAYAIAAILRNVHDTELPKIERGSDLADTERTIADTLSRVDSLLPIIQSVDAMAGFKMAGCSTEWKQIYYDLVFMRLLHGAIVKNATSEMMNDVAHYFLGQVNDTFDCLAITSQALQSFVTSMTIDDLADIGEMTFPGGRLNLESGCGRFGGGLLGGSRFSAAERSLLSLLGSGPLGAM